MFNPPALHSRWVCKREGRVVEVVGELSGSSPNVRIRNVALGRTTNVALDRFYRDYKPQED